MKIALKPTAKVETTVTATIKGKEITLYSSHKEFRTLSDLRAFFDNCYTYVAQQLED